MTNDSDIEEAAKSPPEGEQNAASNDEPVLICSESTKSMLSPVAIADVAKLSGARKSLFIVTADDFYNWLDVAYPDLKHEKNPKGHLDKKLTKYLEKLEQSEKTALIKRFLVETYPDHPEVWDWSEKLSHTMESLYLRGAFSRPYGQQATFDRAIIVAPALNASGYMQAATFLDPDMLNDFSALDTPDVQKALMENTLWHEIGHLKGNDSFAVFFRDTNSLFENHVLDLQQETDADYFAHQQSLLNTSDREATIKAIDCMNHIRAYSTLHHPYPADTANEGFVEHGTNAGFNVDKQGSLTCSFNALTVGVETTMVNKMAWTLVEEYECLPFHKEHIPKKKPEFHYAAVKALLDKGYFPQGTAAEEIACEFVDACEYLIKPEILNSKAVQKFERTIADIPNASEQFLQEFEKLDPEHIRDVCRELSYDEMDTFSLETPESEQAKKILECFEGQVLKPSKP